MTTLTPQAFVDKWQHATLANLYNQRPTWLDNAHQKLDAAVFAAHGGPIDLSDDDTLYVARPLELKSGTDIRCC